MLSTYKAMGVGIVVSPLVEAARDLADQLRARREVAVFRSSAGTELYVLMYVAQDRVVTLAYSGSQLRNAVALSTLGEASHFPTYELLGFSPIEQTIEAAREVILSLGQ